MKRYLTARNVNQEAVICATAVRQIWVDQSQSTNLYLPKHRVVKGSEIASWYFLAWELGVKTLYYLKGVSSDERTTEAVPDMIDEVKLCSIADPDCQSCQ